MSQHKTGEEKALLELAKFQSTRDFKQGLRAAEHLLKKNPKCSEALAYKAYFTYLKDKDKADECVKMARDANRLNMSSATTWKICGTLYKEQSNFKQFYQSYTMAHLKDPSDMQALSELCNIHFFFGNYEDYYQTTHALLQKTGNVYSVMRFITSLYFTERFDECHKALAAYQANWAPAKTEEDMVFKSEFIIFHSMVFVKLGAFQECLDYIEHNKSLVRDSVKLNDIRIQCYKGLDDKEKLLHTIEENIKLYPEDGDYFDIIEEFTKGEDYIKLLLRYKDEFQSKYAWVRALELMDPKDERYEPLLRSYIEPLILKAAPAAYQTVKDLPEEGIDLAVKIVSEMEIPINCFPIVKLFRANVFARKGENDKALEEVNAGLEHTPTAIELLVFKAKHLRNIGRVREAMDTAHALRHADPADRSTNNLYVQTLLLAGILKKAESQASMFAGEEAGKPLLFETQFNTYYLRAGLAHLRNLDYKHARDMYEGIYDHFDKYRIGEFNYIAWAAKKPRALIELTEYLNSMEQEKQFYEAASYAMRLAIFENRGKEFLDRTIQSMKSLNPETLAICCHIFAQNKVILPAIRCWVKIGDSPYKYLALPALNQIVKLEMPPLVKEVVDEHFKAPTKAPETFEELFASAQGKKFSGDDAGAKKDAEAALAVAEGKSFKEILKFHTIIRAFFGTEIAKVVCPEIEAKFPQYELLLIDEKKFTEEKIAKNREERKMKH